jgi:competence protein ComEA
MPRRFALVLVVLLALSPSLLRRLEARPRASSPCIPEGRGLPPRHWIGCAADPGPPRGLSGRERLLVGLPIELNRATADDLAPVPGLSARLAAAVVADRERRGVFPDVDALLRVRGIGPARLAKARSSLSVEPVARRGELR